MSVLVLVHGGGLGGWLWQRVTPLLRDAGHEVHTPTLTGIGERAHLLTPEVCLSTHIADVVSTLWFEDLSEVVLIGHSYAGMVITGVADRVPERISKLVYLDAVTPLDGESHADVNPERIRQVLENYGDTEREVLSLDQERGDPSDAFNYANFTEKDAIWVRERRRPHPLRAITERLEFANPDRLASIPSYYVYYTRRFAPRLEPYKSRIAEFRERGRYREVDSTHLGMIAAPQSTADVLIELAGVDVR